MTPDEPKITAQEERVARALAKQQCRNPDETWPKSNSARSRPRWMWLVPAALAAIKAHPEPVDGKEG
jgi:hypothetical protein